MTSPLQIRRCLKCQGFGHLATDCPNSKVITLEEWEAEREEDNEEKEKMQLEEEPKEELEEIEEKANEGELLVLKRNLSSQKGVEDRLLNTFNISEQGKGFTFILIPLNQSEIDKINHHKTHHHANVLFTSNKSLLEAHYHRWVAFIMPFNRGRR